MKSKAPLVLIEQAVMLLVFALSSVLCLRCFVWADATSGESTRRDQALVQAQSAAETLKACAGDLEKAAELCGGVSEGETWIILYDEDWRVTDDMHTYTLCAASAQSGLENLGRAEVTVYQGDLELTALEVCWQEVCDGA